MDLEIKAENKQIKQISFKNIAKFISTVISWTIFTLLIICASILVYHFVSMQIAKIQGKQYQPKYSLYTIMSPSMTPNINRYDVVVDVKPKNEEDIEIGDVISFISVSPETKDMNITHRVVSIIKDDEGNYSFVTKGDANLIEDSTPVPYSNVIGKVTLRIPLLGRVQSFVANSYGWLLILMVLALYIIINNLVKSLKKKQNNSNKSLVVDKINISEKEVEPAADEFELPDIKVEEEKVTIEENDNSNNIKEEKTLLNNTEDDEDDFDLPELK